MLFACRRFTITVLEDGLVVLQGVLQRFLVVQVLVELLRQEVDLGESNDQGANDSEQQTEAEVEIADKQLDADESEREAGQNGENELEDGDELGVDLLHWKKTTINLTPITESGQMR